MTEIPNPIIFPAIPEERIGQVFRGMASLIAIGGQEMMMGLYAYGRNDPNLSRFVDRWAGKWDRREDVQQFKQGATFVDTVLVLSSGMPKVNRHTVKTFEAELDNYFDQFRTALDFARVDFDDETVDVHAIADRLTELEGSVSSDFKLSDTLSNFAHENRPLLDFLATRSQPFIIGGYLVYELRRRQFLTNQLKRTMRV